MFFLAEMLHMTVGEIMEKMTVSEYTHWIAYLRMKENG